jgi:hypothetical protein
VHVRPIDPRDTEAEVASPAYRVYFWERETTHDDAGFRSDEYEIDGAEDVREVLDWAEANSGGNRTFTAYVVIDKTLVLLSGHDPTATS